MGKNHKTRSSSKKTNTAEHRSSSSSSEDHPSPPSSGAVEATSPPSTAETHPVQVPIHEETNSDSSPEDNNPTNPVSHGRRRSSQLSPNIKPTPVDAGPVTVCDITASTITTASTTSAIMEEDGLGLSNGIDHAMNGIGSPTNSHHGPTLVRYVSGSRADMEIINPPTDHLTQSPTASQRRFSGNLSYAEVLRHSPTPDPDRPKHQREAPWLPEDPSAKKPKLDSTPESIPGSPDTAVAEAAEEATAMAAMMAAAASSGMPPQGEFSFNPPLSPSTAAGNGQKNLDGFMKKFLDSSASFPNTSSANGTKRPRRNSEILSLLSERESSMASLVQRVENLEKQAGIVNGQGQQNGKGAIGRGERKEKTTTVQYVHEPQWGWSVLLMAGAGLLGGWMGAAMESGRFKERVVNVLYRMVHPAETGSV